MKGKTGRPALDPTDRSVRVTLTLAARRYDELYVRAVGARQSVPEFIRSALERDGKIGNLKSPVR